MSAPTPPDQAIARYADFWPHYLREHSLPATRAIHFIGTAVAVLSLCAGLVTGRIWYFPMALAAGYGPAWIAHFFVERNRPATFTYPLWSLISDFRMAGYWTCGKLGRELERAGVTAAKR